jgi:hypothetical protein
VRGRDETRRADDVRPSATTVTATLISYWALDATHSLDSYVRRWCLTYGYKHGDPAHIEVHQAEEELPLVIA